MAEGVKNVNVVFSIGFLNKKIEENLPMYKGINILNILIQKNRKIVGVEMAQMGVPDP